MKTKIKSSGAIMTGFGQMLLTSPLHPRNGANKRLTTPAITPGMRSRIKPSHEFLHGAPIDDEPVQKSWEGNGNVTTAFGMKGEHDREAGNAVLQAAGRLSRKE